MPTLRSIARRGEKTGDYYSADRKYFIEKGMIGWNVSELNEVRSKKFGYDVVSGDFLVDLDTFLNAHRFFEDMEALG